MPFPRIVAQSTLLGVIPNPSHCMHVVCGVAISISVSLLLRHNNLVMLLPFFSVDGFRLLFDHVIFISLWLFRIFAIPPLGPWKML